MTETISWSLRDVLHLAYLMRELQETAEDHEAAANETRDRVRRIAADLCDFITNQARNLHEPEQAEFERIVLRGDIGPQPQ